MKQLERSGGWDRRGAGRQGRRVFSEQRVFLTEGKFILAMGGTTMTNGVCIFFKFIGGNECPRNRIGRIGAAAEESPLIEERLRHINHPAEIPVVRETKISSFSGV